MKQSTEIYLLYLITHLPKLSWQRGYGHCGWKDRYDYYICKFGHEMNITDKSHPVVLIYYPFDKFHDHSTMDLYFYTIQIFMKPPLLGTILGA